MLWVAASGQVRHWEPSPEKSDALLVTFIDGMATEKACQAADLAGVLERTTEAGSLGLAVCTAAPVPTALPSPLAHPPPLTFPPSVTRPDSTSSQELNSASAVLASEELGAS